MSHRVIYWMLFLALFAASPAWADDGTQQRASAPADAPHLGPDGEELPAIRWYPSAHLPPVREPYIFAWYFGPMPERPGRVSNTHGTKQLQQAAQRGVLPLRWFWGPQCKYWDSKQNFINRCPKTRWS